jgi:ATP-dependent DNA helicase RecG
MTTLDQFNAWLAAPEDGHLEFKEAKSRYDFEELVKYCVALANEGGGRIILGVTDARPRRVVGSQAFSDLERTKQGLIERLHLRIEAEEFPHPHGRVLIFHAPARPVGMPIQFNGAYWMRAGSALTTMTPDMLKAIFAEASPDFSAEPCTKATLGDLDPAAMEDFRGRWQKKSGNAGLAKLSHEQLLADAELLVDGQLNYAAMILFGTRAALGKYLAQSEIIFEYRSTEGSVPFQQRLEYRQGFFACYDALWNGINLRNDVQSYQDGLFRFEFPTFSEGVVREAILNAVGHRDYRLSGSVFVKQFPRHLEITSPGGFPPGITPENILDQQSPRNRRLAEAFARCGLIERSGQGMNRIYEETIRQSKPLPDFAGTDAHHVRLTLRGEVQNPAFVRFLEKVGDERMTSFTTQDFLVLDRLQHELAIPETLRERVPNLVRLGVVEKAGRGRHLLSRTLYAHLGQKGTYTRVRGLGDAENMALLFKHICDNREQGSPFADLAQVLPSVSERRVKYLLKRLKEDGKIEPKGGRRWARWIPAKDKTGGTNE